MAELFRVYRSLQLVFVFWKKTFIGLNSREYLNRMEQFKICASDKTSLHANQYINWQRKNIF